MRQNMVNKIHFDYDDEDDRHKKQNPMKDVYSVKPDLEDW